VVFENDGMYSVSHRKWRHCFERNNPTIWCSKTALKRQEERVRLVEEKKAAGSAEDISQNFEEEFVQHKLK
jgi:hypothetical protein